MQIINELAKSVGISEFLLGVIVGFIIAWIVLPRRSSKKDLGISDPHASVFDHSTTEIKISSLDNPVRVSTSNLDDATTKSIREALERGDKIEAIKILRAATNCDLVTAKSTVEGLEKVFNLIR